MTSSGNKLYIVMLIACAAGYLWLYSGFTANKANVQQQEVCLFKHTTHLPCPSCGATRSVISLTQGNLTEALRINPLGYPVVAIMLLLPIWILADLTTKRRTLYVLYLKMEQSIRKPRYAIPLVILVIVNWIWNISKGL